MYADCDDCGERYHDDDIAKNLKVVYANGEIDYLCSTCIRERRTIDARQVH